MNNELRELLTLAMDYIAINGGSITVEDKYKVSLAKDGNLICIDIIK